MAEYIKRKDAEEYIKNFGKGAISDGQKTLDPVDDIVLLARGLDMIPTADVVEVRHGKWLINSDGYYPYCSECKEEPEGDKMTKYCPYCGAKMDKKEGAEE